MLRVPLNRHREPQRFACVAAMMLCFVQVVADAHVHLDEHEHELVQNICAVCAVSDPGHVLPGDLNDDQQSAWCRTGSARVCAVILSPRPFEAPCPRAPPIS